MFSCRHFGIASPTGSFSFRYLININDWVISTNRRVDSEMLEFQMTCLEASQSGYLTHRLHLEIFSDANHCSLWEAASKHSGQCQKIVPLPSRNLPQSLRLRPQSSYPTSLSQKLDSRMGDDYTLRCCLERRKRDLSVCDFGFPNYSAHLSEPSQQT